MASRVPRCWPATLARRATFLPPHEYPHRTGRTARMLLTRARARAELYVTAANALVGGVWDLGDTVDQSVPRRAEDLLMLLMDPKGLGRTERGTLIYDVAEAYNVPIEETLRAVALLGSWLQEAPRGADRFSVTMTHALAAIKHARYHLGEEPIVS